MKRFVFVTLALVAFIFLGTQFASAQERTFTGIVTDQQMNCMQNPMKIPPQTGKVPAWGKDACVLYWAHFATPKDKIVLYDPDSKTTYQVDSEDMLIPYVGDEAKIKVTGAYDEATKTIHVKRVEP